MKTLYLVLAIFFSLGFLITVVTFALNFQTYSEAQKNWALFAFFFNAAAAMGCIYRYSKIAKRQRI
jgi:hypothetical protein